MKAVTPDQMRKIEEHAWQIGISQTELMINAGTVLADFICDIYDQNKESAGFAGNNITFLAGSGNNGGDCFVAAKELVYRGYNVCVILLSETRTTSITQELLNSLPDRVTVLEGYQSANVKISLEAAELDYMTYIKESGNASVSANKFIGKIIDAEKQRVKSVVRHISRSDIVVDGIFGTGFRGELSEEVTTFLKSARRKFIIAADGPSGGDFLTGKVAEGTIKADRTLCFGFLKTGMTQYPLKEYCGEITVCDIGIPKKTQEIVGGEDCLELIEHDNIAKMKKTRPPDSYKSNFGHILVVAGSEHMRGACSLAVKGALRSGVGIVTTASVEAAVIAAAVLTPESMFLPLEADYNGYMLYDSNIETINSAMEHCDAILLGCGIGVTNDTKALTEYIITHAQCPLILDADAINCLESNIGILKRKTSDIIITPHPGEMARLTGKTVYAVQENRIKTAVSFANEFDVTVVLKGAGTVIAGAKKCAVNSSGNPGMSCGGSGDVLAGIITSLTAQGHCPFDAAVYGAYIHGKAGDYAAEELGQEAMLPMDIINELPTVFMRMTIDG